MSNFKIATKDDVKNAGFIFVKDANTQDVKKIATLVDFQVGLSNVPASLTITGGDLTSLATTFNLLNEPTTLNIGSTAITRTTNKATGAATQTVTLGSTHVGSSLALNAGTGSIDIGISQSARTITIGPSSANSPSAITHTVDIGSIPSHISAITNVNIGTAGVGETKNVITIGNYGSTVDSTTTIHGDAISIGTIGNFPQTIDIGTSAAARTTNIATGAAAQTVTLGSVAGTSALTLDAGTGDINIGTSAAIRTTNIATGAAAQTVNIGTGTSGTQTINIGTFSGNAAVIRIGNYNVTVPSSPPSTTLIYGDGLTLGAAGTKIGFFGITPIVKPTPGGSNFTANVGTAMNSSSTSTGGSGTYAYTFAGIVRALKDLGLITVSP